MGLSGRFRLGMFGGAFDPPHNAHVALAQAAVQQLGLDELRIFPTGQAWHKSRALSDGSHRLAIQNRMAILREAIETSDSKVIVCVTFTEAIHAVADALRKDYSVEVLNGEVTSASKRQQIINDFQNKPDPHILVIHPKTAGHGLTLTAASTIVWWSPTDSQEQYKQACERTDRPGQKHNQRIIHLCSSPTEKYVYDKLASLGEQQIDLLSLYSA